MTIEYSVFIDRQFECKQKVQFIIILLKDFRNKIYDKIEIRDDKNYRNLLKERNSHAMAFHDQFFVVEEGKIMSETKVLQSR
jgi:hypothetical protein